MQEKTVSDVTGWSYVFVVWIASVRRDAIGAMLWGLGRRRRLCRLLVIERRLHLRQFATHRAFNCLLELCTIEPRRSYELKEVSHG
jgi:hypothetical protein